MKQFILGLAVGIAMTASYFLLAVKNKQAQAEPDSHSETVDFEQSRRDNATQRFASETLASPDRPDTVTKRKASVADSSVEQLEDSASEHQTRNDTDSQFYLDEYDRELRDRIDTISERIDLSESQRIKLEKKLLDQKRNLVEKVGEEYLDHIMIDEFSIGFEKDLAEPQIEEFSSYKREKARYAATISSGAIVAGIKKSTGISDERAKALEHALIEVHYNNRMNGAFTDAFSVVEDSLTPAEWEAFRTNRNR